MSDVHHSPTLHSFLTLSLCFDDSNVITMFATGEGILTQKDDVTSEGLREVFATNLFGHFLLVRMDQRFPPKTFGFSSHLFLVV